MFGVRTPSCYCARRRQLTVVVLSELDFECWFADRRTARKRFHYYIRVDRLSAVRVVYAYIYILITDSNNVILFEHSPLKRYARTYVINNDTPFTYFIVYGKSPASGTNEFVSDASEVILLLSSVFVVRLGRSIYRTRFVFYRVLAYYRYGDRGARFEKRTGNRRRQTGNAHVYYAYVRLIIVRDSFYGKYHRRRFPGRDCYSEIRPHCRPMASEKRKRALRDCCFLLLVLCYYRRRVCNNNSTTTILHGVAFVPTRIYFFGPNGGLDTQRGWTTRPGVLFGNFYVHSVNARCLRPDFPRRVVVVFL